MQHERKLLYALTGLPGSGKSTAAYELREWGIYPVIGMGDQMKYFASEYADDQFDSVWDTAVELRDFYGGAGAGYASLSAISFGLAAEYCPGVIVDGVRNPAELQLFERVFPDVKIVTVAIRAPEEKRQQLFYERGDYDEEYEEEQVARAVSDRMMQVRTDREVRAGLQDTIDRADYHVWNTADEATLGVNMAGIDEVVAEGTPIEELEHADRIERNA